MQQQKILYGVLALLALGVIIFLIDKNRSLDVNTQDSKVGAILLLDPNNETAKLNSLFAIDIVLDTANQPIDGVDVFVLHYDPLVIQVVDDIPEQEGIQIQAGSILSINAANIVDQSAGTIKFSQVATGGTNFSGRGILATIHFKAVKMGVSNLKFDFKPGSTTDTNVAYQGHDQLIQVENAVYSIEP